MKDEHQDRKQAEITIRRAERADVPVVLRLIEALADFEQLAPPDAEAQARFARDGWPEPGHTPRFSAWLAHTRNAETGADTPAAYAITFETYSSFLARPTLYIEDIFVLLEFRRQGVGAALMERLEREAESRGCGRMEWVVLDWNTSAQAFYQRFGAGHLVEWQCYRKAVGIRQ